MDIEKRVLLLAIYKRKEGETLNDILFTLESSKVFTLKQGKRYLKELKSEKFIENSELTFLGINEAKQIEQEFSV